MNQNKMADLLFIKIAILLCMFVSCSLQQLQSVELSVPLYIRRDWDAKPPDQPQRVLPGPVHYVVLHHTYIPPICNTTYDCMADMRSMQNFHMGKGWGDIGYNFLVGGEGSIFEGRGWGVAGIHAGKINNVSYGISLIGDFRTELPRPNMIAATMAIINEGVRRGAIDPEYTIIGHSQAMATECPGQAFFDYLSTWPHFEPHPDPELWTERKSKN